MPRTTPRVWGVVLSQKLRLTVGFISTLAGGGGHEPVQLRVLGDGVREGHQGTADPQKAVARLCVGDVTHLRVGDMQELRQLRPVRGRLIEQQQKFRVRQHEAGCLGFQTFLNVLRGGGHGRGVLSEPFPGPVEELAGVVVLKIQVHFVQEYPGILAPFPVLHDAV